jgi:MFS family permease
MSTASPERVPMNRTAWLICIIASIGFAFDIYELLMLPLIVKSAIPALAVAANPELAQTPAEMAKWVPGGDEFKAWARILFFVPAIAGGVAGLLGGYMTDLLGRRRVLTWSILLYAGSAFAAGFATSLEMLLVFRCLIFVGVCVEFVAAVAWLAELFPNRDQRESVLGYTQAFSSLGGVLVAVMNYLAGEWASSLPAIHGGHEAWRYTLISGLIPALPLILIRPFLPESPEWQRKYEAGTLKRPSLAELFSPELRLTTIVTTLAFASTFGLAFGAIQQNPQILAGHVELQKQVKATEAEVVAKAVEAGKSADEPAVKKAAKQEGGNTSDKVTASVQFFQEIGGLAGRLLLAYLAVIIIARRKLFRIFQIPSLFFIPALYWWLAQNLQTEGTLEIFKYAMFIAGMVVVGQMSFWGNYIPMVFPVHLRGTGESFAANIGGRVIGTAAAWLTITFSTAPIPVPAAGAEKPAATASATATEGATAATPQPAATSTTAAPAPSEAAGKPADAKPGATKTPPQAKMAIVAAIVAGVYALVGFALTFVLPEPKHEGHGGE